MNKEFSTSEILNWLEEIEHKYKEDFEYRREEKKHCDNNGAYVYDSYIVESMENLEMIQQIKRDYEKKEKEKDE